MKGERWVCGDQPVVNNIKKEKENTYIWIYYKIYTLYNQTASQTVYMLTHSAEWRALKCVKRDQSSKLHFLRLDKLNTGKWFCILYWNVQVFGWLVRCNIWILHRAYCICTCPAAALFPSIQFLLHIQVCLTHSDNRFSKVIQTTFSQHILPLFLVDLKKTKQKRQAYMGCIIFAIYLTLLVFCLFLALPASLLLSLSACSHAVSSLPYSLWLFWLL